MTNAKTDEMIQKIELKLILSSHTARKIIWAVALASALSGCMSAAERRYADLRDDGISCSEFGAQFGSLAHTHCMHEQQQRRDQDQLLNMERARISSETARNNLETLRIIRERRERERRQ